MEFRTKFSPKYIEQAQRFFEVYKDDVLFGCLDSKPNDLEHRSRRSCRFCKKKAGEATFKKDAHIFPFALGNRYLVSDFECDSCNELFGKYEDELVKFLGITRTIAKTKGRKKIPGFEAKDLKATQVDFFGNPDAIKIASTLSTSAFSYDATNNTHLIKYTKPPYSPINVFKSLLKMALCLVPPDEMKEYDQALKFLTSTELDKTLHDLIAFTHILPISYKDVFGMLFKKRDPKKNATTHTFVLYYSCYMFQIFLPFNTLDYNFYNDLAALFPPIFDGSGSDHWGPVNFAPVDLTSTEKKEDDISILGLRPQVDLGSLVAIDAKTGKIVPGTIDPSAIIGMYMVDDNFEIEINE